MKASKFTDAQKAFILKQGADGHPVAEICRKAGYPAVGLSKARQKSTQAIAQVRTMIHDSLQFLPEDAYAD